MTVGRAWIRSGPKGMMGNPVIAGTRIPVELILEKLAAGETVEHMWLTSGFPVASQQPSQPPTREQILQGLEQALAVTLVASEGDIFDMDTAVFVTLPQLSLAYIPLHPSSRSAQLWNAWLEMGEPFGDAITIGALYLGNDLLGYPNSDSLQAGTYQLKVTKSLEVIATDSMGNEYLIGYYRPRVSAGQCKMTSAPLSRFSTKPTGCTKCVKWSIWCDIGLILPLPLPCTCEKWVYFRYCPI